MPFSIHCGLSTEENSALAIESVIGEIRAALGERRPDLVVLFASPHHAPAFEEMASRAHAESGAAHLIGCSGEGVIGGDREVERRAGVCALAASLPGVSVHAARIQAEESPEGLAFTGMPETGDEPSTLFLLGEPYSFPAVEFVSRLAEDRPGLQVLGGMSSGLAGSGEKCLFLDGEALEVGAVGAILAGPVRVRPVVSQGCRPFGKHLVITRAENNVIFELGGRPAFERLKEQVAGLSEPEQELLRNGLHLGRAIDARKSVFERGDFLIRNVFGVDPDKGAIAITDRVRAGQTVQFHLRDAASASEDLDLLLEGARRDGASPAAALLFSCNGRGTYLFGRPDHDAAAVRRELGPVPLAGFFAAGEIGPVGGSSFLHGFTASLALIEEA